MLRRGDAFGVVDRVRRTRATSRPRAPQTTPIVPPPGALADRPECSPRRRRVRERATHADALLRLARTGHRNPTCSGSNPGRSPSRPGRGQCRSPEPDRIVVGDVTRRRDPALVDAVVADERRDRSNCVPPASVTRAPSRARRRRRPRAPPAPDRPSVGSRAAGRPHSRRVRAARVQSAATTSCLRSIASSRATTTPRRLASACSTPSAAVVPPEWSP